MTVRRKLLVVWLVLGTGLFLVLVPLWHPLKVAWSCYRLHDGAAREQARVLHKLDETATLVLLIEEGPHADQACTADTSAAIFASLEPGDPVEVVQLDRAPGSCELSSTIEASGRVLFLLVGGLGAGVALLVALAAFLHRSFTRPVEPALRLALDEGGLRCPLCGKAMDEGYLAPMAGIHWRGRGQPIGLPHALGGLPGSVGWRGRPRLHAFRCVPCESVVFRYGKPPRR